MKVIETTDQDEKEVELYNKKYQVFKELYPTLKNIYDKMA
jgi:xylulokinase